MTISKVNNQKQTSKMDNEDWLEDPLISVSKGSTKFRKLKSSDAEQNDLWFIFHFATRLKLDGARFFRTKVIDTARTSEDVQLEWYLDGFFFELMAACDTRLQELNIVYAYDSGLKPEDVRWKKIKGKLPSKLIKYMEDERRKDWFCEVQWYRTTTTHYYRIPKSRSKIWWGHGSLHATYHVGLQYIDREGKVKINEIGICEDYLRNMAQLIKNVWEKMAQEFDMEQIL